MREGHLELAKHMITRGAVLEWDEQKASGELCEYTRQADVTHVKVMLDGGCNVNACDYDKVPSQRLEHKLTRASADLCLRLVYGSVPVCIWPPRKACATS